MLLPFEMVEADAGYRGEPACVSDKTHWLTEEQKDQKDTVRARHETVNRRFKQWNILQAVFRHDISKHECVFHAIAAITQMLLRVDSPLFSIRHYTSYYQDDIQQ